MLTVSPFLVECGTASVVATLDRVATLTAAERAEVVARATDRRLRLIFDARGRGRWLLCEEEDVAVLRARRGTRFALDDSDPRMTRLLRHALIGTPRSFDEGHRYSTLLVEINSHCNFRCVFCPVATDPLDKGFMSPETYALVLERAVEGGIDMLELNHFSEPSLDPRLVERVRLAAERGLGIGIYTNLSRLDGPKLRELARLGNVRAFVVNLPSADRDEFERATGSTRLDDVLRNLRAAADAGLPVRVAMNLPRATHKERIAARDRLHDAVGVWTTVIRTHSRAGHLDNPTYAAVHDHEARLNGCVRMLAQLPIALDGRAFLCCQDYRQQNVLGDLRTQSIAEICAGEPAVRLRRAIFGLDEAPPDLMCKKCDKTCSSRPTLSVGGVGLWDTPHAEEDPWSVAPPSEPVIAAWA
jgi:molybdenum cofactor biosynthesis enzyme MoaA